jgi:soluble lytic murein transglycosylase-like protein
MTTDEIKQAVLDYASKYNIDPNIALAQIYQESHFNPNAVSPAGAKGVAQFTDATAQAFGITNPFDVDQSLEAWGQYMSQLLYQFNGRYDIALAAYNSGPNRQEYANAAAQNRGINWSVFNTPSLHGVYTETQNYVATILSAAPGMGVTGDTVAVAASDGSGVGNGGGGGSSIPTWAIIGAVGLLAVVFLARE